MWALLLALFPALAVMGGGSDNAPAKSSTVPTTPTTPEPDAPTTSSDTDDDVVQPITADPTPSVAPTPIPVTAPPPEPVFSLQPVITDAPIVAPISAPDPVSTPVSRPAATPEPEPDPVIAPDPVAVQAPIIPDVVNQVTPDSGPADLINSGQSVDITDQTSDVSVMGGRVTKLTLEDADQIESVRIVAAPEHGNVTVSPDNTLALVLTTTDHTGALSFDYEVTYANGSSEVLTTDLNVIPSAQEAGWGRGEFYMLETDANDQVIVETGDNHRDVFVSGSDDALSIADIAAREGLSTSDITGAWLEDHPEYGGTEGMALAEDAGISLWEKITGINAEPSSHWLQLESGYEYGGLDRLMVRGTQGEDELHPIHITSYGDGPRPIITSKVVMVNETHSNIVFSNVELGDGAAALSNENLIFDNVKVSGHTLNVQTTEGVTIRNAEFYDIVHEAPISDDTFWNASANRLAGLYAGKATSGLLIENSLFDHIAWADDYDPDLALSGGHPPSLFSHNLYIQDSTRDVTFRDSITMQASSFGAQFRGGAFIEDNVFLDNNVGVNFLGGDYSDAGPVGNYTLFSNNIITSGAHRAAKFIGGLTQGVENAGELSTLVGNIVTHLSDPNNPDELLYKEWTHPAFIETKEAYFDDTIIYNWIADRAIRKGNDSSPDTNIEGLDPAVLDQITIQNLTAQLLGDPDATISDLGDYLRAQSESDLGDIVDADLIRAFFQLGFGIEVNLESDAETVRFVPSDLGDGIRWDNRLNWDTQVLPDDAQSVDLAGNWVNYGGTTTLEDLDFGDGGKLNVTHGYLEVADHTAVGDQGAELNIDGAGQVWLDGYTDQDKLTVNVDGGRFANEDIFVGTTDLNITDGEAILATGGADFALNKDSSLKIVGDEAKVGFDGTGNETAVLMLAEGSTLGFEAKDGALGNISEFRSGHFGEGGPDVQSGVNLGDATLEVSLAGMGSEASSNTIISVDELIGNFGDISIEGLGSTRDATLMVDYDTDEVRLELGAVGSGTGQTSVSTIGDPGNAQTATDLWASLTNGHGIYADDPAADIPEEEDILENVA